MRISQISFVFILLIFLPLVALASNQMVSKENGEPCLFSYKPSHITSLDELSPNIRNKVISHLKERLGSFYAEKLHFARSMVINRPQFIKTEPDYAKNHFKGTYYLSFEFSDPSKGISLFQTLIVLDERGNVLEDIGLPNLKEHPEKADIISIDQAKKIAQKEGFQLNQSTVEIDYDHSSDSFLWKIEQRLQSKTPLIIPYKNLWINAHTGRIEKQFGDELIN